MAKSAGLLGVIVLAVAAMHAQDRAAGKIGDSTEKMLIASERSLYEAVAKADKVSFLSLVVPEGVWTTPTGFVPMGLLANGLDDFQLPRWGVDNPRVTWSNDTSALLLYARTGGGTFNGQPLAATTLASTLWTKRGDKWLAVHHQETDLTPR